MGSCSDQGREEREPHVPPVAASEACNPSRSFARPIEHAAGSRRHEETSGGQGLIDPGWGRGARLASTWKLWRASATEGEERAIAFMSRESDG